MKQFSNHKIIEIVEEYENSRAPEKTLEKYNLNISIIKNWIKLIERGNIQKENKCLIHNLDLIEGIADIKYGRVIINSKYRRDKDNFTNSNTFKLIGRKISRTAPKKLDVNYCPKCRALEQEWVNLNGEIFGD